MCNAEANFITKYNTILVLWFFKYWLLSIKHVVKILTIHFLRFPLPPSFGMAFVLLNNAYRELYSYRPKFIFTNTQS